MMLSAFKVFLTDSWELTADNRRYGRVVMGLALFELDVKSLEKKFTEVRDHL